MSAPSTTAAVALGLTVTWALALAAGCDDPADEAVAATVEEVAPGESEPRAPGAGTASAEEEGMVALHFSSDGSAIEWQASKVTRSHDGRFGAFTGTIYLRDDITASMVEVDIETASIEADVPRLTEHLRTADFFDVRRFPRARFRSEAIVSGGPGEATHTVRGLLELHGHTVNIEFPATIRVHDGGATVRAEFSIDRQQFGITFAGAPDDLIRDRVLLRLTIAAGPG